MSEKAPGPAPHKHKSHKKPHGSGLYSNFFCNFFLVRQKCIEEIILGGSGPLTLLQAAKERNMLSTKSTKYKQIREGNIGLSYLYAD